MSEELKDMEDEIKNPIDCLFDEENTDPISFYNEKGEKVSFEQIAIIPLDERVFAILKPLDKTEGIADDEALVFEIVQPEDEEDEEYLNLIADLELIDKVFDVYNKLMDEEEAKNKIDKKGNK